MRRYFAMIAAAAVIALSHLGPASANKRPYPVKPMTAKDLRQVPAGAAIWFHKKGKYWFHVVVGGHGYMKIDGKIHKFRRLQPTGNKWGCDPMVFGDVGTTVRIYKRPTGWVVRIRNGTQLDVFTGLSCKSGD